MPESRGKNLSAESIDALLLALGLAEDSDTVSPLRPDNYESKYDHDRRRHPVRKSSLAAFNIKTVEASREPPYEEPPDMDEAQMFGRNYLSDFDVCSDFGEDSDSLDYDTIPPRPGSSLDSFEMIDSDPTERYSVSSDSTFIPPDIFEKRPDTICLKVAHNASIIMLRTPWEISLMDLKRRLYDKFVNQEGIFLAHTFSVVLALRPNSMKSPLPSPNSERVSFAERTEMQFISHESDWRRIVSLNDGSSKITLRILDTPLH